MTTFVYGTLMFKEVLHALINRMPRSEPAVIHGYQRHRIRGQPFPGTIRAGSASSSVRGLVLFDLTPLELEMFDEFEGDEYFKQQVQAELDSGDSCDAAVYLWQDSLRSYLEGEWDPDAFRELELPEYVLMCKRFAADVRQQRGWKGQFLAESGEVQEGQQGQPTSGTAS